MPLDVEARLAAALEAWPAVRAAWLFGSAARERCARGSPARAGRDDASPGDRPLERQWAAAYGLQVTAQSLLDASAHVLTAALGESPTDYAEIVALLARHGIVDPGLATRLRGLGGFRNVLVDEYAEVDFALVHDKLGRLDDLAELASAHEAWLVAREG